MVLLQAYPMAATACPHRLEGFIRAIADTPLHTCIIYLLRASPGFVRWRITPYCEQVQARSTARTATAHTHTAAPAAHTPLVERACLLFWMPNPRVGITGRSSQPAPSPSCRWTRVEGKPSKPKKTSDYWFYAACLHCMKKAPFRISATHQRTGHLLPCVCATTVAL